MSKEKEITVNLTVESTDYKREVLDSLADFICDLVEKQFKEVKVTKTNKNR